MKLVRTVMVVAVLFFAANSLYSQQAPPAEPAPMEKPLKGPPGGDPGQPGGAAVPLDGALWLALLAGGGIFSTFLRKEKADKVKG